MGERHGLKQAQHHAQLELLDKDRAIKELVVCWVLPYLIVIPWAIERVTLQILALNIFKVAWKGLYPKRHLAPKSSIKFEYMNLRKFT